MDLTRVVRETARAVTGGQATWKPPAAAGDRAAVGWLLDEGSRPGGVAQRPRALGVRIYTISLGTATGTIEVANPDGSTRTTTVPPDPATMATIARTSRGKAYRTADAGALAEVYRTLGSRLATKKEERELTSAVAGLALLLMLSGSGLSLGWFGRPA